MKNLPVSKLFALILLSVLSVWFTNCKKNDDPTTTTTPTVEGNYKVSSLKINPKALGQFDDLLAAAPLYLGTTCLTDLTVSFKTGGVATVDNPTTCQNIPIPVSAFTGIDAGSKWTQSGNKLTVTKSDNTKTEYTIVSNTGSIMQLQWQGLLNYPAPSTTMYTYTMDLKKQ